MQKILTADSLKKLEPYFKALKDGKLERKYRDSWNKVTEISLSDSIADYRITQPKPILLGDMVTALDDNSQYMVTGLRHNQGREQFLVNNSWCNCSEMDKYFNRSQA